MLTPSRYGGAPPTNDDGEPCAEKMQRPVAKLRVRQARSARLDAAIAQNLEALGSPLPSRPAG